MLGNLRNRISIRTYRGKRCLQRMLKHRFHRSRARVPVTWFSTALSGPCMDQEVYLGSTPHPIACTASSASASSSKSYHYPTLPRKQQHGAHTRKFNLAISPCQLCRNPIACSKQKDPSNIWYHRCRKDHRSVERAVPWTGMRIKEVSSLQHIALSPVNFNVFKKVAYLSYLV